MQTTIQKFMDFEMSEKLFDYKIHGFRAWPYLRFTIYMRIEALLNAQQKRIATGEKTTLKQVASIIYNCTFNNPNVKAKKSDVFFIAHARRTLIDGKYECLYTDEIANQFADSISGEFIYGNKHFQPIKSKHILYLDYVDIYPAVFFKIYISRYRNDLRQIALFCTELNRKIKESFGVDIGEKFLISMTQKRYIWYLKKKQVLTKLLKKMQPKVIIETVSYETNKMIINEIAHELSIPTIELQHGVIGPGHIAYNYKEKLEASYLPQYICLFSQYWKDTAAFPQKSENLIPTGYPYLERMMNRYPAVNRGQEEKKKCLNILVISQPEYSIKLYKEILKLVKILDENKTGYKIFYKLHPAEYGLGNSQFMEIESNSAVELIKTPDINLYELFSKADIQVGVTSTAIFEGLAYGLKTLIFHYEKTDEYMGDVCKRDLATMCENAVEAAFKIENYDFSEEKKINSVFFVKNSISNIVEFIDALMKEK